MINKQTLTHYTSVKDFTETLQNLFSSVASSRCKATVAQAVTDYSITKQEQIVLPEETVAYFFTLQDDKKHHTVAFCRDKEGFFYHCGNLGIQKEKDNKCNFFSNPIILDVHGESVKCCKHVLTVLSKNLDEVNNIHIPELEAEWQKNFGIKKPITLEPADELEYIKRFAFKANIIIEGDRGSGKTYDVMRYANETAAETVFLGGHNGIESIDLLGYLVPYSANQSNSSTSTERVVGNASDFLSDAEVIKQSKASNTQQLVWKDGAIAEAFRKASKGNKTILVLDELLRVPQRELNILLTALSPIHEHYILRTGRIVSVENGVAQEETIKAPVGNLFVVATTNIGGQYAIDDIDPALAERFIVIRKDTTENKLKTVLKQLIARKAFDKKLTNQLSDFFINMKKAKKQGFIENTPTIRTISRSIELADTSEQVWDYIRSHILLWIGRDMEGYPIPEQEQAVATLIQKAKS